MLEGKDPTFYPRKSNKLRARGGNKMVIPSVTSAHPPKVLRCSLISNNYKLCSYRCYYKLSFEYYTEYEADHIQMAYCIPYQYYHTLPFLGVFSPILLCATRG